MDGNLVVPDQSDMVEMLEYFTEMKNLTDFVLVAHDLDPYADLTLLTKALNLIPHVSNIFFDQMYIDILGDFSEITSSPQVKHLEIAGVSIHNNNELQCTQAIFAQVLQQCMELEDFILKLNNTA
jgi:hypothetical protein